MSDYRECARPGCRRPASVTARVRLLDTLCGQCKANAPEDRRAAMLANMRQTETGAARWNVALLAFNRGEIGPEDLAAVKRETLDGIFNRIMAEDRYQARQRGPVRS